MRRRFDALWLIWFCCLGCAPSPERAPSHSPARAGVKRPVPSPKEQLATGFEALKSSRYDDAERAFLAARQGPRAEAATLGLAELALVTGRYEETLSLLQSANSPEASVLRARAEARSGHLAEAIAVLQPHKKSPAQREARLLLGELLLEQGKRQQATAQLMTVIEDYNADRIKKGDGDALAMVGRAAFLLRSPHDANDAFNEAERAAKPSLRTLLWRAELFLDKYDPGHAEEVVSEALEQAPHHPDALVWMARVRLEQALDFDAAERLARQALEVNPRHAGAHFVLAGIALRDMELQRASEWVKKGLAQKPNDLALSSMQAAVLFLADDRPGFEAQVKRVLELNPGYSRVYQIVGEYAEWEHRYDDIVSMMEDAVRLDPNDAKANAQLGINLIRAGDDDAGVLALRTAFDQDPFNVRVFNTLNLYEKVIPEEYVSVPGKRFNIRYPKKERALLERYVPKLLDEAFRKMVRGYGFEPETPVGIELYSSREHFSVRTSGLPQTAIQGVCFGHTLASMSLAEEKFNLGMTLWHELAHVFHIQLSKNHVPRWFTEGLAEYETLSERPEWSREHDPALFEAFRSKRMPELSNMSRAFTRAEQASDVATAYYASSRILTWMVESFGLEKVTGLLRAWGKGERTEEAFQDVLERSGEALDRAFKNYIEKDLARYRKQFFPVQRVRPPLVTREALKAAPGDPARLTDLARSYLATDKAEEAEKLLDRALRAEPNFADALYLKAEASFSAGAAKTARSWVEKLLATGHDGYFTELLLGKIELSQDHPDSARKALEASYRYDPTQAEPLGLAYKLARQKHDTDAELELLEKLTKLEEHAGSLHARRLELLVQKGDYDEAVRAGEAGLWSDLSSFDIHYWFAEALAHQGDQRRALFELESALLCEARPKQVAQAHERAATLYRRLGQPGKAREHERLRQSLRPSPPGPP